jgi:hypothetical protein
VGHRKQHRSRPTAPRHGQAGLDRLPEEGGQALPEGGKFWKEHPGLPRTPAKSWQIWNEPNLPKYFVQSGSQDSRQVRHAPKAYARFVKASSKAVHHADKHAKVVLAGLSGNALTERMDPPRFIRKFLKVKRITRWFNAAALHPYAPTFRDYRSRISQFRKALNRGGAKRKKIWLTEVGWGSADNGQRLNKGIEGQAKLLSRSFKVTLKKRKRWRIQRLFWFDWRDPPEGAPQACSFCSSAGLLERNGEPKPAWSAYKSFAAG